MINPPKPPEPPKPSIRDYTAVQVHCILSLAVLFILYTAVQVHVYFHQLSYSYYTLQYRYMYSVYFHQMSYSCYTLQYRYMYTFTTCLIHTVLCSTGTCIFSLAVLFILYSPVQVHVYFHQLSYSFYTLQYRYMCTLAVLFIYYTVYTD